MTADPVRAIADAVLYEGYVLWPYRRSALKNQRRFTWGGVYPPAHSAAHPDDPALMQIEVLLRAPAEATVQITLRFLHVVQRAVARIDGEKLEYVDELEAGGRRHLAWDEAAEHEIAAPALTLEQLAAGHRVPVAVAAGTQREDLGAVAGGGSGALIRSWRELRGELRLSAQPVSPEVWRVSAAVANRTPEAPATRQQALEYTLCSTHLTLHAPAGGWISATDPPAELADVATLCVNEGAWPVLVGEPGSDDTVLASPIILEDHPRIAPESPGDLFDGGEIDGLLILNILALTDEEKAEMAASDPRAREILRRTEALTPQQLMALHGTVRDAAMVR